MTANGNAKKPTTEELFIRAQNAIESDREYLKEFHRLKNAFDSTRMQERTESMFPRKHHTETRLSKSFVK